MGDGFGAWGTGNLVTGAGVALRKQSGNNEEDLQVRTHLGHNKEAVARKPYGTPPSKATVRKE